MSAPIVLAVGMGAGMLASAAPSGAATITVASFNRNYTAMSLLKSISAKGHGEIEAILPDTVSSARYTEFDAPDLNKAFAAAGLSSSQYKVQNAQGSDTTQFTDAQSAISAGASVIVVDPLDSGVGARIETYASQHGVKVVDYDRLTLGGSRAYYVSFNNVLVGQLIGKGFVSCATAWHVSKPNVLVMRGAPTDNNATLFAQGYNSVLNPKFSSGAYVKVGYPTGTWTPSVAETTFQQQLTAHKSMNSAVVPNDENAAPIITYLKTLHTAPKTFPLTGQDATLDGLDNVLSGYQCGTVYKPIDLEAQAAVALAVYLRAGEKPPTALVNGTTEDTVAHKAVASVLLTPEWVTTSNMKSTVIPDKWVTVAQLCAGQYASACKTYGVS